MKAVLLREFGAPDQLYFGEAPNPTPLDDEVLINVAAAALNRADLMQRQGFYPPPAGASEILGLEVAGTVVGVGKNAEKWLGKRVMALLSGGGYAQQIAVDQGLILEIPENLGFEQAAAVMEAFLTAYQAIHWLGKLKEGEKILIHAAASGVGTAAIQLAGLLNAEIWATASAAKHDLCKSLGAHHCIDYQNEDFTQCVLNSSVGVDVCMDFIAGPYFQQNLKVMALDGRLVMQGSMGGTKLDQVQLLPILKKRLTVVGSTLRSRSLNYRIALVEEFGSTCLSQFLNQRLKPIVDRVFPWQQVQEAHLYMQQNKNQGKIVLRVNDE